MKKIITALLLVAIAGTISAQSAIDRIFDK